MKQGDAGVTGTRSKKVSKVSNDLLKVSNECQEQIVFHRKMRDLLKVFELFEGLASKFPNFGGNLDQEIRTDLDDKLSSKF